MAFFGTAKSCHEIQSKSTCHATKINECASKCDAEGNGNCCKNERVSSDKLDYDATLAIHILPLEKVDVAMQFNFIANYFTAHLEAFELSKLYSPPESKPISVLPTGHSLRIVYQSFLC